MKTNRRNFLARLAGAAAAAFAAKPLIGRTPEPNTVTAIGPGAGPLGGA